MTDTVSVTLDSKQTFKSGIRDLVCAAMENGGKSSLGNCELTTKDGKFVQFEINCVIKKVEVTL
jgi:hypothetical protein